jgi:hypothetical protein
MKKLLFLLHLALSISTASANELQIITSAAEENLIHNKIYFFAHSMCMSCKDAFIYIQTHHKDLDIPITDMKDRHNLELYKQCVKKFNIKNKELRLPLICMKDNYIMGWTKSSEHEFENALKNFNSK